MDFETKKMSRPLTEFIFSQNLLWEKGLPGNTNLDLEHKILSIDYDFGDCSIILKYPKGWSKKLLCFEAEEELFILEGSFKMNGKLYEKGNYACLPAGFERKNIFSTNGCIILSFFSKSPKLISPNNIKINRDELIEQLNVIEMPWDKLGVDPKLEFMGIKRKTLKWDNEFNQKRTFLLSTSPHNFPENWECEQISHPCVEEAFMLAGTLSGPQGIMTKGSYFWRPENIPHGPFGSLDGSLTLIRFMYGKHINIWGSEKIKFNYDMPYKPILPPNLGNLFLAEYNRNENY